MRRWLPRLAALLLVAIATAGAPRVAAAQGSTAESLTEARRLYEDLQVERALILLRQVISPQSPFEVSREQRVQAYVYLGASLAILGMRDSAVVYFRAALERDPFADLDPARFTERERDAFSEARRRTLAVAIRPLAPQRLDPRSEQIPLAVVSTHPAALRAEIRGAGDTIGTVLFDRQSDGVRELGWNARRADGALAPAGRYWLVVRARDDSGAVDSAAVGFELVHEHAPLEDSLPPLGSGQLLPERWSRGTTVREIARGAGMALAGYAIAASGSARLRGDGRPLAGTLAIAAVAVGVAGAVDRWRHPLDPRAIAENRRRRDALAARNAEIAARNAARLAELRVVVIPAAANP